MKRLTTSLVALLSVVAIHSNAVAEGKHSNGHEGMKMDTDSMQMEMHQERFQATGVINSIDSKNRKVNVSHEPIKALGWPEMTMDFGVSDKLDLAKVILGQTVGFMLVKSNDGSYVVDEVMTSVGHSHTHEA